MSEYVLAADMGGTNLRMAAVGPDGDLLDSRSTATPSTGRIDDIVNAIVALAEECRNNVSSELVQLRALGIAAAALVSAETGTVLSSPNLPQLNGVDLAGMLQKRLSMPVILENDANAAAVAEHWLGAAAGVQNAIMITLGTGVGGGLILNGELFRGSCGTAGEIGHINVDLNGVACGCGSFGCIEQYASATGIVRMAREAGIGLKGDFSSFDVYNAAVAGDAIARATFQRMASYLGTVLAGLVNVLNPDIIVVGGGVAAGWDIYIERVRQEIENRAFQHPVERAKLVRAKLGDHAGILGAARLALRPIRKAGKTAT